MPRPSLHSVLALAQGAVEAGVAWTGKQKGTRAWCPCPAGERRSVNPLQGRERLLLAGSPSEHCPGAGLLESAGRLQAQTGWEGKKRTRPCEMQAAHSSGDGRRWREAPVDSVLGDATAVSWKACRRGTASGVAETHAHTQAHSGQSDAQPQRRLSPPLACGGGYLGRQGSSGRGSWEKTESSPEEQVELRVSGKLGEY